VSPLVGYITTDKYGGGGSSSSSSSSSGSRARHVSLAGYVIKTNF